METPKKMLLPGPAGNLEVVIEPPLSSKKKIVGIVCHPHPVHGGTMNNKVVTTVVRVFQKLDIVPIRFNFRGVGASEGVYDQGVGELQDLFAVIDWVKTHYPDYRLVLAGFSFGSYIAAKAASSVDVVALITLAPPVHHNPFAQLPPAKFPWIIVQGDADEVVPPQEVFDWIDQLPVKPIVIRMQGVSHFFHGQLIKLRDELIEALKPFIK